MTDEEIFRLAEQHGDWDDFGRWVFRDIDQLINFVESLLSLETKPETSTVSEKREWVGLTDEEIKKEQHHIDWTSAHTYAKFARAIEAKLKEKNT